MCCFQVTRVDGEQLLKYQGDLERIVCVRLRCKRAYTLACSLLEHTLRSLSLIYPTEYRSTSGGFDTDLPIRVNTHKGILVYHHYLDWLKLNPVPRLSLICSPSRVQIGSYNGYCSIYSGSGSIRFSTSTTFKTALSQNLIKLDLTDSVIALQFPSPGRELERIYQFKIKWRHH